MLREKFWLKFEAKKVIQTNTRALKALARMINHTAFIDT